VHSHTITFLNAPSRPGGSLSRLRSVLCCPSAGITLSARPIPGALKAPFIGSLDYHPTASQPYIPGRFR